MSQTHESPNSGARQAREVVPLVEQSRGLGDFALRVVPANLNDPTAPSPLDRPLVDHPYMD